MSPCLELLGNIIAVFPVPIGVIHHVVPLSVVASSVSSADLLMDSDEGSVPVSVSSLMRYRGFLLDTYYNITPGQSVLEMEDDASLKETQNVTVAGVTYTSKLTFHSKDDLPSIRSLVADLMDSGGFDLVLVDSLERIWLVRGTESSCRIQLQASLPLNNLQQIDIDITSVNGVQSVTDVW